MNLITTRDLKGGLRNGGEIPWFLPSERNYFNQVTSFNKTSMNVVIMGRYMWEALGSTPLKNRINIVISKNYFNGIQIDPTLYVKPSITDALALALSLTDESNVWFIGGKTILEECLKYCKTLVIIDIHAEFLCNVFFNPNLEHFINIRRDVYHDRFLIYSISIYEKYTNNNEKQYIDVIKLALLNPVLSVLGTTLRFDLTDNKIPLLTTRKITLPVIDKRLLSEYVNCLKNNSEMTDKEVQLRLINGEVSIVLYKTNSDLYAEVPFDIAKYSLIIHLISAITKTKSKEFIYIIGCAFIRNEQQILKEQSLIVPNLCPTIKFKETDDYNNPDNILIKNYF